MPAVAPQTSSKDITTPQAVALAQTTLAEATQKAIATEKAVAGLLAASMVEKATPATESDRVLYGAISW